MTASELTPDLALKALLDGKVYADKNLLKVYAHGELPNTDLDDDFLSIARNGVVRSMTKPIGVFRGSLALSVYCMSNTNFTEKTNRLRLLVKQCEDLINCKTSGEFFFELNAGNPITPASTNLASGYTTTVLNVDWHTRYT